MSFYAEDLAYVHHHGFPEVAEGAGKAVLQMMQDRGIDTGAVVDLGCAGGLWARRLSDAGYRVTGYDISAPMIDLARRTAADAEFHATSFLESDLPPCRAVTAFGEIFNYVLLGAEPKQGLRTVFAQVAACLEPGGLFAFDMIVAETGPPMHYRSWKTGTDWAVLVAVKEDQDAGILRREITIFRDSGTGYRRSEENHTIGVPQEELILQELQAAGFTASCGKTYGDFEVAERRRVFLGTKR